MALLVIGLAISIPLIVAGAALIMALLDRFPILVWAGAALLGWIVGEVIATDPVIADIPRAPDSVRASLIGSRSRAAVVGAILVLVVGGLWRRSKRHVEEKAWPRIERERDESNRPPASDRSDRRIPPVRTIVRRPARSRSSCSTSAPSAACTAPRTTTTRRA